MKTIALLAAKDFTRSFFFSYHPLTSRAQIWRPTGVRGNTDMPFVFGDHALDCDRRELSRRGEPVAVAPQVFDLLVYLIRNRERVVSKDDLIEAVWGGRIVSDSALTTRINAARTMIGNPSISAARGTHRG